MTGIGRASASSESARNSSSGSFAAGQSPSRARQTRASGSGSQASFSAIRDAASAAGFGSYAQFHRIFRQHLGVTPRDYLSSGAARSESERVSPSPKPHS